MTALGPTEEDKKMNEESQSSLGISPVSTVGSDAQEHDPSGVASDMDTFQAQELGQDEATDAGTVDKQGKKRRGRRMFTYDWENGPHVKWAAVKTSQVNVVSPGM